VTVLFADLAGSTEMAVRLDPEGLRGLLSAFFQEMGQQIRAFGGTVEKYAGDAIMAVFGVPDVHEDDAERAVRAALSMQQGLDELNPSLEEEYGTRLELRVGIATGVAVAATRPVDELMVSGQVAHLAARLQAASAGIVVSAETHAMLEPLLEGTPLGPISLKGFPGPLPAFRVSGLGTGSSRARGIAGVSASLIGREAELETLRGCLAGSQLGRRAVELLHAEVEDLRAVGQERRDPRVSGPGPVEQAVADGELSPPWARAIEIRAARPDDLPVLERDLPMATPSRHRECLAQQAEGVVLYLVAGRGASAPGAARARRRPAPEDARRARSRARQRAGAQPLRAGRLFGGGSTRVRRSVAIDRRRRPHAPRGGSLRVPGEAPPRGCGARAPGVARPRALVVSAPGEPPFRAEHIGSLLRPPELRQAFRARADGALGEDEFRAVLEGCIREAVRMQEEVGLRSITDGEFRRTAWSTGLLAALEGLEERESRFAFRDESGNVVRWNTCRATRKLGLRRPIALDEFAFVRTCTERTPKVTLPAPSFLHFFGGREFAAPGVYRDLDVFYADAVQLYREEIARLAAAGATWIQLDEVPLAMLCDDEVRLRVRADGEDPDALVSRYVAATNAALAGRPPQVAAAVHLCRGNLRGHWMASGSYEAIAEQLFGALEVDAFLLEYDTERAGDFAPLRFVRPDARVVLGLVSTKTPVLEGADALERRLEAAARHVPLERLGLSPQCGFASTAGGNPLTADDQRRKLARVVEVAERVWG
jgi:5-methyltetrahydropteroyltriglutamate--homocysteine methyltransferase